MQQLLINKKSIKRDPLDCDVNYIVPVKIKLCSKGLAKRFAIICVAHTEDIKNEPVEPKRDDNNQIIRKQTRAAHMTLLKKLRKTRKKKKQAGEVSTLYSYLLLLGS